MKIFCHSIFFGLCVGGLVFSVGCKKENSSLLENQPIEIGATLPLSGDAAVFGKNSQQGIDLAMEEINDSGGILGRKVKIDYEDTKALAKEGVTAYQKLVSLDKVPAIIDDSVSSVTLAMAPLADKDQIVILATGATAPQISGVSKYVFRIWNSDAYEGEVLAEYAANQAHLTNVAILYINNDYGKGLEGVFSAQFTKRNGKVADSEAFDQGSSDMRAQITKIKATNPDGIYLVAYPKEAASALRQIKELGVDSKLLGTVALNDQQVIDNAGNAADGLVFPFPKDPTGAQVDVFKKAFETKYGKQPPVLADVGYDALHMIAKASERSKGITGQQIQEGLRELKDYAGASGVKDG